MSDNRTNACKIPLKVKNIVWERDNECCIICGTPYAKPNAHYIPRSQNGRGIEQNVVTLCQRCHHEFDQTTKHSEYKEKIKKYLQSKYEDLEEYDLVYRKYNWKI